MHDSVGCFPTTCNDELFCTERACLPLTDLDVFCHCLFASPPMQCFPSDFDHLISAPLNCFFASLSDYLKSLGVETTKTHSQHISITLLHLSLGLGDVLMLFKDATEPLQMTDFLALSC